ncbi:ABC transporter permease [Thalassomonas viridans]|uniref:ABC transporter permease n=1 Tax=Thalassomonas viridans TaxID=137584 RepID=A0AAF0CCH5_9GAMM|nr:ABC transporter permease [Thalassomonas viridans]WDE07394.1 ABC transporter permease [Thalassomonas viridans]
MVKLFFIVAWRNLCREKLITAIQLLGLAIGIACFILIRLYVGHEQSYNRMFTGAADIYRLDLVRDQNRPQALTPMRLGNELKQNFDDVLDATRLSSSRISIKHQQGVYSERALFVDSNYFRFFDFDFIEGDPHTALNGPASLVLPQALAIKYFGRDTGIIGKSLTISGVDHQVTGVLKKPESPTSLPQRLLLANERFVELALANPAWEMAWTFNATVTFVRLVPGAETASLQANISDFYQQRAAGLSSYKSYRLNVEALTDLHLYTDTSRTLMPPGSGVMVTAFGIIAVMILLLACVNFTNLSTAAAMRRGKDVGVRKALGASKRQLIVQYLSEAVLQTSLAGVLALLLAWAVLPYFNQLMEVNIVFDFTLSALADLLLLTLAVGVIAGLYPAFYLSKLAPALVLKGVANSSAAGVMLRQGLIVFQFAIAALLLVASLGVNWQMSYIQNMPQGYDREGVIVINRGADIYNTFKNQLLRHPEVAAVTMSHTVPTKATRTSNVVRRADNLDDEIQVGSNPVSYDFFATYGINILAGRDFSREFSNDAYRENEQDWKSSLGKIIINQTLARALGWTAGEAVGQMITLGGGDDGLHNHQVIAVVEDSHYISVKTAVPAMIYVLSGEPQDLSLRWTSVRFKGAVNARVLSELEQIWLSLAPDQAFTYDWIAAEFASLYRSESKQRQLLNVFTLLAVVVTAIGLFGLAAFNTRRRVKEIAIRKILGAGTAQLCFMLVNQFSLLVLLANLLVMPLAWYLLRDWLNGFIYRIDMPYGAFALSALFSLLIAYITVMVIAYRAANATPVDALQYE